MTLNLDILIVIASLAAMLGLSATIAGWADGARPRGAPFVLVLALGVLALVQFGLRDGGFSFRAIPDAFIHVVAMVLT
jgi:hypothetical protein